MSMRNFWLFVCVGLMFVSCFKGKEADLIIHNAQIFSFNLHGDVFEAMAIKDGKILELGSEREILNKYRGKSINAEKKEIYPGFYDAHAHIFGLAEKKLSCDLTGSRSLQEVINRLERFDAQYNPKVLVGKGWDQSLWVNSELPTNELLNQTFPDKSVLLFRVDGHAMLANQFALNKANVTANTTILGGEVQVDENGITGILLDNAMDFLSSLIPAKSKNSLKKALIECQEDLLQFGITHIHEAGITLDQLEVLQELESEGKLKITIYAMLFPEKKELEFAKSKGILRTPHLHVRSFKIVADGALGSRGACLTSPYHDMAHSHGFLLKSMNEIEAIANVAKEIGYQLNVHCIGDSTNRSVLKLMAKVMHDVPDHRWRIEHAQIVHPDDIQLFKDARVIPSVQPTHAVSDMRFVQKRLGTEREKWAYAYKSLLNTNGIIALGTDFPVEDINPFHTIEAAVNRKNPIGDPQGGYLKKEGLTLDECLKGMTLWAAIASFEENEQGSLEPYKDATFVILHNPLRDVENYTMNYAKQVYLRGQRVYQFD